MADQVTCVSKVRAAAAPVLRDVTEEPMLDLVPLARARWEVRDVDAQARSLARRCSAVFQPARAIAVAAASIGGDVERSARDTPGAPSSSTIDGSTPANTGVSWSRPTLTQRFVARQS